MHFSWLVLEILATGGDENRSEEKYNEFHLHQQETYYY
jgi:hypothetical protein